MSRIRKYPSAASAEPLSPNIIKVNLSSISGVGASVAYISSTKASLSSAVIAATLALSRSLMVEWSVAASIMPKMRVSVNAEPTTLPMRPALVGPLRLDRWMDRKYGRDAGSEFQRPLLRSSEYLVVLAELIAAIPPGEKVGPHRTAAHLGGAT